MTLAALLVACSSSETPVDGGFADAAAVDTGVALDTGVVPDAGVVDAGSEDAATPDSGVRPAFETTRDQGASTNRIDLVFIGDGYTSAELSTLYSRHINHVAGRLFASRQAGATEPFRAFNGFFNVHRVNVPSAESGIDGAGTTVDSVLGGTLECEPSAICHVDPALVDAELARALPAGVEPDVVFVVLNTRERLARLVSAGQRRYVVYGGGPNMMNDNQGRPQVDADTSDLALRELAKLLGGVEEETTSPPGGAYAGAEPAAPNVTTSSVAKWAAWLDFDVADDGIGPVGLFEGGAGFETGIWRPTEDSKMGSGGLTGDVRAFNAVVREALVFGILSRVSLFDSALDNGQVLTNPGALYAGAANTDITTLAWLVDGQLVEEQTENTFGFTAWARANGVPDGAHEVTLRATVQTQFNFPNATGQNQSPLADFVRNAHPKLVESITWQTVLE